MRPVLVGCTGTGIAVELIDERFRGGIMARKSTARKHSDKRWSGEVTAHSNALDLDRDVFTWKDPHRIATSLKHSAEHSERRKTTPFQSAMSMLTFYINRAGDNLDADQRRVLERAKDELRKEFGKTS
jgi:hypothetical protein